jgi:hypothetical protein
LVQCLKSTLTSKSNILLVNCASPNQQYFEHTLPAVKFCSRIRETIIKKSNRAVLPKGVSPLNASSHSNLRIKTSARIASDRKQTTFGPQESLESELDAIRVKESPERIADQLERELATHERKVYEGTHLGESKSIRQWCLYSLELANMALFYAD